MEIIKYPTTDYNSFVTEEEADAFFEGRLHASKWDGANKVAALLTAYRSLSTLDIVIDPTVSAELEAMAGGEPEGAASRQTDAMYFLNQVLRIDCVGLTRARPAPTDIDAWGCPGFGDHHGCAGLPAPARPRLA